MYHVGVLLEGFGGALCECFLLENFIDLEEQLSIWRRGLFDMKALICFELRPDFEGMSNPCSNSCLLAGEKRPQAGHCPEVTMRRRKLCLLT